MFGGGRGSTVLHTHITACWIRWICAPIFSLLIEGYVQCNGYEEHRTDYEGHGTDIYEGMVNGMDSYHSSLTHYG